MGWCAYLIPFLFAYMPALLLAGTPGAIASALGLALFGILIGTIAVVGFFLQPVSLPLRLLYAIVATALLLPSTAFPEAVFVNLAGLAAGIAALAREVLRRRGTAQLAKEDV
jgi:TRAP-type uncharacterized transport system fused permease subunit